MPLPYNNNMDPSHECETSNALDRIPPHHWDPLGPPLSITITYLTRTSLTSDYAHCRTFVNVQIAVLVPSYIGTCKYITRIIKHTYGMIVYKSYHHSNIIPLWMPTPTHRKGSTTKTKKQSTWWMIHFRTIWYKPHQHARHDIGDISSLGLVHIVGGFNPFDKY